MSDASDGDTGAPSIERGTYEVIRERLLGSGRELSQKAEALNASRLEMFGGTQLAVSGSERLRTENNCVPRDIVAIGNRLLFGYNVFIGLKRETRVDDVFSFQTATAQNGTYEFSPVEDDGTPNPFADERFRHDFRELYAYYSQARLLTLRKVDGKLLAVFQVGRNVTDVKGFRWALGVDGSITYIDNQADRDHGYPPTHDFEWTETSRDDHALGLHPHVSILDEVFVETVGGDLTVKVEDNTADGLGVYRESVVDENQGLDDASIHYAKLGSLILIRLLPFREEQWRYLVFNTLTQHVSRIDHIGQACVQLPEDHGIIFPGGYYLQRGETKTFAADIQGMRLERTVRSPNGEDVLYVFYRQEDGAYVLLPYNMIRKQVDTPIRCHGYCLFEDGRMVVVRAAGSEATRVHPIQVWQTPFTGDVFADARATGNSFLERVGNADLVRGISDCLSVHRMVEEQKPTLAMYEELIAETSRVLDQYHWLGADDVDNLLATLRQVRETAELVIDEFEKVQALRAEASRVLAEADERVKKLVTRLRSAGWKAVEKFVDAMTELRRERGRLISLRDVRYIDVDRVTALEQSVIDRFDAVSAKSVEFLVGASALEPYLVRVADIEAAVETVAKVTETAPLTESLNETSGALNMLTEVVGGLAIDDATVRTSILEAISEVMASLNRARALLQARRRQLLRQEGVAEFAAQFSLLAQSVSGALAMADTPERCDDQLSRLMVQLEEMEGRFSEFDEFLEQLTTKREEIYEALEGKKQSLLDQQQRRAHHLMQAVERILAGVARRASGLGEQDDLNAYFASDAMVMKVREMAGRLRDLDDSVRADEVESRLKSAREDAVRALRDRQDLFEDGASVIRLGKHRFSVNTQALDLTLVPHDDGLALHLTGTDFREPIVDETFEATREYWAQELVSETPAVYRSEYLAYSILAAAETESDGLSLTRLTEAVVDDAALLALVREHAASRYDEGYERGVHDHDAAAILSRLVGLYGTAGLLRFAPHARAAASVAWAFSPASDRRDSLASRASSLARLRTAFAHSEAITSVESDLCRFVAEFHSEHGLELNDGTARVAGRYLFEELARGTDRFVASGEAAALRDAFLARLDTLGVRHALTEDLDGLDGRLAERHALLTAWMETWLEAQPDAEASRPVLPESVGLVLTDGVLARDVQSSLSTAVVEGVLGQHARIDDRRLPLRLDEFLGRLSRFLHERVPAYRAYQRVRAELLERERERLRISEYLPRVLSSFVRNRLIDEVYLPLIGDNLAKQLGARGEGKRTDLMGLLLLISPPGYGKTTLMEYVANRLGLVFMKINGPALGHGVTSLDPAEAPSATARQEVQKINLAFEMGNNVLLYLDDIQHTHPELLQKFISLCDATRKVEGVWRGRTQTYDLRGKKFVVCMAGNPYTESGERFQVPDMLANRADVYNLGDVLSGKDDLFALSYIENALTSNPVLAQITTHDHRDVHVLVRMARGEEVPASELQHDYPQVEREEILAVLRKVLRVQEVLLAVNREYIRSASMDDDFRTEPPFGLQGSYRNMNKLAEKIVAVMNDAELEALLVDHYAGESQTLTSGAEQNLLKLAELRGALTEEQAARWDEIRAAFQRRQRMGGDDDDPVLRVTSQLGHLGDRVESVGESIRSAAEAATERQRGWQDALVARREQTAAETAFESALAAAQADDGDAERTGEAVGRALTPVLERIAELAAARPEPALDLDGVDDADGFAALATRQAEVIEVGLLPVLRSLNQNLRVSRTVWDRLNSVSQALAALAGTEPPGPLPEADDGT